jgi:hypothetical protein
MKNSHFSMHFSNNAQPRQSTSNTSNTRKNPPPQTQAAAQAAAQARFRMYTAMNDVLYTGQTGGCSSCGNK